MDNPGASIFSMSVTRVFDFNNYKDFVNTWVLSRPKKGRGDFLKMAKAMNVHTSHVSQIFKGERDLNLEQADALADFLNLNLPEKKYFFDLINHARAGTKKLKLFYDHSLKEQKKEADRLKNRLKAGKAMTEAEKLVFYADSIYSHVHLLTYLPNLNSVDKIAKKLKRDKTKIQEIVDFLISAQLIKETPKGLVPGEKNTHVDDHSPYVLMHHRNWRLKAMQKQGQQDPNDLFYSGQMTISRTDFERCKEILRKTLEEFYQIILPSESEEIYNFNFDFYQIEE